MTETIGKNSAENEENTRSIRGHAIAKTPGAVERATEKLFIVRSQSGYGTYVVEHLEGNQTCTCPDFVKHSGTFASPWECKHIAATRFYLQAETVHADGTVTSEKVRLSYPQAWHAYNEAQKAEIRLFDQVLSELVAEVTDPREAQKKGRPRLVLSDLLFCTVQKTYSQLSLRRAYSLFGNAHEHGQVDAVPSFNMPSAMLNRADITPILHDLIAKVALPLVALEQDFAVDSSGFRTTCYGAWCQEKHGLSRVNKWLKAHIMIGTKTHIIPTVIVTDGNEADSPQFPGLVNGTVKAGFVMKEVYGDKGYLSRDNYNVAAGVGATPYIAFKVNSRGHSRGGGRNGPPSPMWKRMYHLWQADPSAYDTHYHMRENVEAVFAAIKKKLGETLKSKNPTAQVNELLCKILAYNITVLIHEMYEHGVTAPFLPEKSEGGGKSPVPSG